MDRGRRAARPGAVLSAADHAARGALEALRATLRADLDGGAEAARVVALDQPIGRLSRMDAMQQQQMAAATQRALDVCLAQVEAALKAIDEGAYGECRGCGEAIGEPRLRARPEAPFCLACQSQREHR